MLEKRVTCCFTGHRHNKLPWGGDETDPRCISLKTKIFDAVEAVCVSGIRHFISGMATGSDMYFCEEVIRLRNRYPEITLEAAIPFEGQAHRWSRQLRDRHEAILRDCDYKTIIQKVYTSDCMMRRNRYMVDSSSVLIAAFSGDSGGTMNTILYAMRKKLEIIEILI